jgi:hypothetical protein
MSITLTDVPAAVADYIRQNVTIEVSEVTHGKSSVLQPNERATFAITLVNATDVVGLVDIVYDVSIHPDSVAVLRAFSPTLLPCRKKFDLSLDPMNEGDENGRLVIWPAKVSGYATLVPGGTITFGDFSVQTKDLGDATVKCHIYASVDQASLFPPDQPGSTVEQKLTVQ